MKLRTIKSGISVSNGLVEIRLKVEKEGVEEKYYALHKRRNHLVCSTLTKEIISIPPKSQVVSPFINFSRKGLFDLHHDSVASMFKELKVSNVARDEITVRLFGNLGEHQITKTMRLVPNSRWIQVIIEDDIANETDLEYLLNSYAFVPDGEHYSRYKSLDYTWAPNLRPEDDHVIGDHVFRSPAIVLQKNKLTAALVPDLDILSKHRPMQHILDLDIKSGFVDAPLFSYGFCDWQPEEHVYYRHDSSMIHRLPKGKICYGYYLYLNAESVPMFGYQDVLRFLWSKWGQNYFQDIRPQVLPFAEYGKQYSYPRVFSDQWREEKIGGKLCGGVVSGWRMKDEEVPNQAWFCNMRSAYGVHYFAKQWNNEELLKKSGSMLNLALAAPIKSPVEGYGICPDMYSFKTHNWSGDYFNFGGGAYYSSFNSAWKGYWLLRWYNDLEKDERIIDYCKPLGNFYLSQQLPTGAIPSWFSESFEPYITLSQSAQSALPGMFLLELYIITHDQRYLAAAEKVAVFLMRDVIPEMKYYDFETFFSCSPKPVGMKDEHTGMWPQNTLSIQWTAEMLRRLYEITKKEKYLPYAVGVADVMCWYQQVWPINFYDIAYLFGGFGVQNTDGEYNDARQSQFGCTLADLYRVTGNFEYLQRGVAAVRAAFALINTPENVENKIYPEPNFPLGESPENCCHCGYKQYNCRTGFDWGEGSALTGAAYLLRHFGGVYINVKRGHGIGIDGCQVNNLEIDKQKISFNLVNTMMRLNKPYDNEYVTLVKFDGIESGEYDIIINGKSHGKLNKLQLLSGIEVKPKKGMRLIHLPVNSIKLNTDIPVSLVIESEEPVKKVMLYYSLNDEPYQKKILWLKESGLWAGTIEKDLNTAPGKIKYYIEAITATETATEPLVNPAGNAYLISLGSVFDFESGDLQGWKVSNGKFGLLPTNSSRCAFNKQGKYFIGTGENENGDCDNAYVGELKSPEFVIEYPIMSLLIGGGKDKDRLYIALRRVSDNRELFRETGRDNDWMDRRVWDLRNFVGQKVYFVMVDNATGQWGHLNVDDIRYEI